MPFSSYADAESFLLSFVNYEASVKWPVYNTQNFDIERFAGLLERIGAPHRRPGLIHVAGTKGKGSTCAILGSILTAAGLKTGVYTSPHLKAFYERIRIDRSFISDTEFAEYAGRVADRIESAPDADQNNYRTTFEILTAMALLYFADSDCDAAVMETGLGGRLDATNVIAPELTVITAIGLDHVQILGSTLAEIAAEKGGIIKPGVPCVVVEQSPRAEAEAVPVLERIAAEREAPFIRPSDKGRLNRLEVSEQGTRVGWFPADSSRDAESLVLPLLGDHQVRNLATALTAVEALRDRGWGIDNKALREGVADVRLAARCEVVGRSPLFVVDAAHCPLSMRATAETISQTWPTRAMTVLYSSLSDKNAKEILGELARLPRLERVIIFPPPSPRACPPEDVAALGEAAGLPCETAPSAQAAMVGALAGAPPDGLILATGSFYSIAPLKQAYLSGR